MSRFCSTQFCDILYYYYSFENFWRQMMAFHWSLNDCKSPQVSTTLFSIPADPNTVVWIVITCPIFKSFSSCTDSLVIVLSSPITISITVTFMLYSFLLFSTNVLVFLSLLLFLYTTAFWRQSQLVSLFSLTLPRLKRLTEISWSACISKCHRTFSVLFSRIDSVLCLYHFAQTPVDYFPHPVVSSLIPFLCASLLHLFIWLIVSSLSLKTL